MIDEFFDGYNATVFAYGQTGSGKTYTMGNEFAATVALTERGVIPRVIENVFERVKASVNPQHFVIKLSYLQVLNEEIHDLLAKPSLDRSHPVTTGLSIRGDGDRGIVVAGLSEHVVNSTDQTGALLRSGALARATASTSMNVHSSRSHAICTLIMERHEVSAVEGGKETRFSKFHLVDLAGSERVRRTNSEGARFKEGVNINRGLLALGNVINALCERSQTNSLASHIPYRDSKLTRLLQDSLGGNSKTLMIACISPADINYEETANTLRYATRTRNVENQAIINKERSAESEVMYLKQQLEILKLQLLQQAQDTKIDAVRIHANHSYTGMNSLKEENRKLKDELLIANSAKDKWKKIADELAGKNIRESKLDSSKSTPISALIKKGEVVDIDKDKDDRGNKSGQLSRLEQLRKYRAQKLAKEGSALKRKTDGMTTANKRSRVLMSPSAYTPDLGRRSSGSRTPPSPFKKVDIEEVDTPSMGSIRKLLQQIVDSQQAILCAKEAVRVNVSDRKTLALEISQLESSAENTEKLAKLQDDLRTKTANIRLFQQKLVSIEKNAPLPAGIFPAKVNTCHELIKSLIEMLMETKEECMGLANYRRELDATSEKFMAERQVYSKKILALNTKLDEVTRELRVLQEQNKKKKSSKKRKARESYETMDMLFSSSGEEEDNNEADPDYVDDEDRRQRSTKRTRDKYTSASNVLKNVDVMDEIDELLETSIATCCSCHGKCATKACACKSQSRVCSEECSCNSSKCQNRCSNCGDTPGTNISEELAGLVNNSSTPSIPIDTAVELTSVVTPAPSSVMTIDLMSP
ncbi:Kinesin-like protein [Phytophthora palmivora]|uniref:Kinesin-like protein n=1 Tax=Phytophthora palmivora TaxID=4796 RepID=A0A2P4XQZ6_9STRA|nr:Kinesin-like protein [Phytophthora palmivora]